MIDMDTPCKSTVLSCILFKDSFFSLDESEFEEHIKKGSQYYYLIEYFNFNLLLFQILEVEFCINSSNTFKQNPRKKNLNLFSARLTYT